MERGAFKELLKQAATLTPGQESELAALLDQGGQRAQAGALIDALAGKPQACPRCQSQRLHRHGRAHGLQRYLCLGCARSFNMLTGTPLARLRQRDQWPRYCAAILASRTVRQAATDVGIHKNTSFRWRHRFLSILRNDRRWPLQGITEADETYLLESQKGSRRLTRPARRRAPQRRHPCAKRQRLPQPLQAMAGTLPRRGQPLSRKLPGLALGHRWRPHQLG